MNWAQHLALLLGTASPFSQYDPEAVATAEASHLVLDGRPAITERLVYWADPARFDNAIQLAQHRSHRSHRSHSSHRSHYSSSGGGYSAPRYVAPAPRAPAWVAPTRSPSVSPLYSPPVSTPSVTTPSSPPQSASRATAPAAVAPRLGQSEIIEIIRRVQIALLMRGYDPGLADGVIGPKTQQAIRQYQIDTGLAASGHLDAPTMDGLGVR
jgi:His-Xaa-Ser repeat protein HxsA